MQRREGPGRAGPGRGGPGRAGPGRTARGLGPRPNELSDMGRVNATPLPTIRAGQLGTGARSRPVPSTTSSRVSPRLLLAVGGGILWFIVTTVAGLVGGPPSADGSPFLLALAITCLVGAAMGRTWGDDVALALGSVAGLVLSSLIFPAEPAGSAPEDVLSLALYVGAAVVLLSPLFRRLIAFLRQT